MHKKSGVESAFRNVKGGDRAQGKNPLNGGNLVAHALRNSTLKGGMGKAQKSGRREASQLGSNPMNGHGAQE